MTLNTFYSQALLQTGNTKPFGDNEPDKPP